MTGTAGNDTFNAVETVSATNQLVNTWTTGDAIVGGAGTDILNVTQTGAVTNPVGATVTGVEQMNVLSATTGTNLNTTTFTGLETLNITAPGTVTARAAATTAMTVTNAALDGAFQIKERQGSPSDWIGSGNTLTVNGGSAVNVTTTENVIDAPDGHAFNIVGSTQGVVNVGAAAAAAGAVVVNTTSVLADIAEGNQPGQETAGAGTAVNVTGGTTVTVNNTLTATGTSDNKFDALTGGAVSVTGNASTTSVSVTQTAARERADTGAAIVNGAVTILDANRANATADSIATVTLANYGASTIESGALTTLNLSGTAGTLGVNANVAGANQTATTLALNLNGLSGTNTVTLGSASTNSSYTTVNLNSSTAASNLANLAKGGADARVATLNISGDAALTLGDDTALTATAAITSTNTAGVTLSSAIGTTQTFTGGAGNDTISLLNSHDRNVDMGAGNDTVTYGGALAATRTVNAGIGTDTIVMTDTQAAAADNDSVFNATFSGFETLRVSNAFEANSLDLDGINGASRVILAAGVKGLAGVTNLVSGGTVEIRTDGSADGNDNPALTVGVRGALLGTTEVLNLALSKNGILAVGSVTADGVETVNITASDAVTTALGSAAAVHTMTLAATSATTITVSGNNGLNLTNTSNAAVTRFDASGVVANGNGTAGATDAATGLAVTFTSANSTAGATVTIIGGAGNDVLTGHDARDVITGGAGADTINGGAGADTFTGGAGADTFRFVAGQSGAFTGGSSITGFDVITDFTAGASGDVLDFGTWNNGFVPGNNATAFDALTAAERTTVAAEATLLDAANAALAAATDSNWTAFAWQGSTYAIYDTDNGFDNTAAVLVQLTGVNVADLVAANFA